ncbi:MAG: adenosylmethionine decarboxylase [Armatimonadetes bacterium]|nr:adenosylmethionine decarboxylase [Armatimonadota bacterium]
MANIFIHASALASAVIAFPTGSQIQQRFRGLFRRAQPSEIAGAPTLSREGGWQFIRCDDEFAFDEWLRRDEHGLPNMMGEEDSLGSHLLIELYGCNEQSLKHEHSVGKAMRDAAVESEATVVAESFHEFKPWGVSGAVIIQESHYTIHTWPEHKYAAVDLFYCGGTVQVHQAVNLLRKRFQPERMKFLVVRRGLQSEVTHP